MKMCKIFLKITLLLVLVLPLPAQEEATAVQDKRIIKRYCIIIGCNTGSRERKQLKFAVSDALHIKRVFENLGGVVEQDSILLDKPNRESFFRAFQQISETINRNKGENRIEVIIYYSGHSDDQYLLMGNEKISYYELKLLVKEIEADVRIAILDSCSSGALTREKGGKKKPPFLVDNAHNMKGYAFLTSSSDNEASQESDRLGGSFFTHNLIAGLRGAADINGDQKVTLQEVYQYASNETLSQTLKTVSGPQHPNFSIDMAGRGDVILTDIRNSESILVLDEQVFGKIFIHDTKEYLEMELRKQLGKSLSLGLTEGKHRITLIRDNKTFEHTIELSSHEPYTVYLNDFVETDREITQIRGKNRRLFHNLHIRLPSLKNFKFHMFLEMDYNQFESHGITQSLPGFKIGFIFKEIFYLGFGGYGNISLATQSANLDGLATTAGYGGIEFGYQPFRNVRISALAGAGALTRVDKDTMTNDIFLTEENSEPFFVFEPRVSFLLNLNKNFHLMISFSRRFIEFGGVNDWGSFEESKFGFGLMLRL